LKESKKKGLAKSKRPQEGPLDGRKEEGQNVWLREKGIVKGKLEKEGGRGILK